MAFRLSAVAVLLLAAACGRSEPVTIEQRLQNVAQLSQALAPVFGVGDIGFAAEGDALVVRIEGAVVGEMTEAHLIRELRPIVCDPEGGYRGVIEDGGRIRFELTNTVDKAMPPATIAYCPPV